MKTEDILWQSIRDIENGFAKTTEDDPINGWLDSKARGGLTKINICAQSAKYTKNHKPISRPTLDSFDNILTYLSNKNSCDYQKQIKELQDKLKKSNENNSLLKEGIIKTANENYQLREHVRVLEEKLKNKIKIVD